MSTRSNCDCETKNYQEAKKQAKAVGAETPKSKPIMPVTSGVIVLLMIGSVSYHTLTYLP